MADRLAAPFAINNLRVETAVSKVDFIRLDIQHPIPDQFAALITLKPGNVFFPNFTVFTMLLLGHFCSSVPFWDVFLISIALSFGAVLRLSNITPGGSELRVVGRNTL